MSDPDIAASVAVKRLDEILDDLNRVGLADTLPPNLVQKMLTVGVRNYARCFEVDATVEPLARDEVNATEVANTCLEMLRVAELELFELTFWGGRLADER